MSQIDVLFIFSSDLYLRLVTQIMIPYQGDSLFISWYSWQFHFLFSDPLCAHLSYPCVFTLEDSLGMSLAVSKGLDFKFGDV